MAGSSKESPRQKMVGMMYLVLTAMLAMQVQNTVLDKFINIDDSLQETVQSARHESANKLEDIRTAVEKRGNRGADIAVLEKARKVMDETSGVMEQIISMRKLLVERTGGIDENGEYVKGDDEAEVMALTLGPADSKSGMAYELEKLLNDYSKNISALDTGLQVGRLALGASEIPRYQGKDGQEGKDFAQLNFAQTPMVAALAVLSEMQAKVVRTEANALGKLAERVGAHDLVFDRIIPVVSPESHYIVAGMPYKAKIYTAAYSSTANPEINSNVGRVRTNEGIGLLEFVAGASEYDAKGHAKKTWSGQIKLSTPTGDTLLNIREEYVVVKPSLQFKADAVQALYRNCGNSLNVQVPELGASYAPEFSATEATVIPSDRTGVVTIIPKGKRVKVTVKNSGVALGTQDFRVKAIPKPSLELYSRGQKLDLRKVGDIPRNIQIKAIPDADFAEQLPQDARYQVTEFEVILAKGSREVYSQRFRGNNADLTEFARQASGGGYRLIVEAKQVERMNFRNEREKVTPTESLFVYTIK